MNLTQLLCVLTARERVMKEKPSAYLAGKCECLAKVVDFFASTNGGFCRSVKDKRTVFLSQIDFWDWEMDELIFSVSSFEERSKTWESCLDMQTSLSKLNLPVDPAIVYKITSERGWNTYQLDKNHVVPPIKALNEVIKKWNKLLKICEDTLFMDRKQLMSLDDMGCKFIHNLDKYRKKEHEHPKQED